MKKTSQQDPLKCGGCNSPKGNAGGLFKRGPLLQSGKQPQPLQTCSRGSYREVRVHDGWVGAGAPGQIMNTGRGIRQQEGLVLCHGWSED